jgi:hypothetical protein
MSFEQSHPNKSTEYSKAAERNVSTSDYSLLGIAIVIDFVTAIPFSLSGIGIIVELPLMVSEALFLKSLGVPPMKSVFGAVWDFIPFLDIMPWCTLAVLDKKFGVKLPYLTKLYNR